jgi:hypothetical protein
MKNLIVGAIAFHFVATFSLAQNPPLTVHPYATRGNAKSPDGKYEWIVKSSPTIQYELIDTATKNAIATVKSYYPDRDEMNVRYANAVGAYWNQDSSVVALDELNRRRAGYLYFFTLTNGKVRKFRAEQFVPLPKTFDEARFAIDGGWISPVKIRIRLAEKSVRSNPKSIFYVIDFSNPNSPQIQPAQ